MTSWRVIKTEWVQNKHDYVLHSAGQHTGSCQVTSDDFKQTSQKGLITQAVTTEWCTLWKKREVLVE